MPHLFRGPAVHGVHESQREALNWGALSPGRPPLPWLNHKPFVEDAISHMAAAAEARQAGGDGAREREALQNAPKRIADSSETNKPAVHLNANMLVLAVALIVLAWLTRPHGPWRWW